MKQLLLLHGALGAQSQFDELKNKLGTVYECHSLDFYGHGSSSFSDSYGIEAFAAQVLKYIDQFQLKGCDVFGYSMGGYVAIFTEYGHPGTFGKIMTLGTKFNWTPESSEREVAFLNPEKMKEKAPKYVESLIKLHGDKWTQLCEKTAEMMRYLGALPLITDLTLAAIRIPVRVGIGDDDKMVTVEETMKAFRSLQQGSFLVMPTTPHPLDQVNMDRLAYKIERYLES